MSPRTSISSFEFEVLNLKYFRKESKHHTDITTHETLGTGGIHDQENQRTCPVAQ